MILNGEKSEAKSKGQWHYLAVKKNYQRYQDEFKQKIMVIFIVWILFVLLEQKTNLNRVKKYMKIKAFFVT